MTRMHGEDGLDDRRFAELEARMSRALADLPPVRAPHGLAARIVTAASASSAAPPAVPARQRRAAEVLRLTPAGIAAAVALLALAVCVTWLWELAMDRTAVVGGVALSSAGWAAAGALLHGVQPYLAAGVVYIAAMGAACAVVGSLLKDVALGGASHT